MGLFFYFVRLQPALRLAAAWEEPRLSGTMGQ